MLSSTSRLLMLTVSFGFMGVLTTLGIGAASEPSGSRFLATIRSFLNIGVTQQVPIDGAQYPSLPVGQTALGLYYDVSTAASSTGPTSVCFHLPAVTTWTG